METMITFIKDCKDFMKRYPLEKGDNKRLYFRNLLYLNAQCGTWLDNVVHSFIRLYDKIVRR